MIKVFSTQKNGVKDKMNICQKNANIFVYHCKKVYTANYGTVNGVVDFSHIFLNNNL